MDQRRFDVVIRALAAGTTRRRGLAAALGTLFGGAAVEAASRPREEGPCGKKSPRANACKKNGNCCTKYCDKGRCRCKPNWMSCTRNKHCCSGRCAGKKCDGGTRPAGESCTNDFNCDSDLSCVNGVCKKGGSPACGAGNCPGCCEGTTCRQGTSAQACGARGAACAACGGGKTCDNGACAASPKPNPTPTPDPACGPSTCANGCCKDGQCVTATYGLACGTGGAACFTCSSLAPLCASGACYPGDWQAGTPLGSYGTANNQLKAPSGIAVTSDRLELYIGDYTNKRVAVWTRTAANSAWQAQTPLTAGIPGPTNNVFNYPFGVGLPTDGLTLLVTDSSGARVDFLTRASAAATWTPQTPLGDSQPSTGQGNGDFYNPEGLTVSPGGLELYVADTANNRVTHWKRASTTAAWAAQTPLGTDQGSGNTEFDAPAGVDVSADGLTLYVADSDNHRISVWTRTSTSSAWGWSAMIGASGSNNNQLSSPYDVAVAWDHLSLYIADSGNNRIAVWTRASTSAAWQAQTPLGFNQPSSGTGQNQFDTPYSLALSADAAELFVADTNNNRITVWKQVAS